MPDFQIRIDTQATGDGAQRTAEQLAQLKATLDKLNAVTGKSAADSAAFFQQVARGRQDSADNAQALSDMTREAKGFSGEVQQRAEPSIRALARGFRQLGREVPIVGVALNALTNFWTVFGAVIGIVTVKIKEAIAVQNELARSGAELSARLDPVVIKQIRNAQVQAETTEAIRKHNEALADQNTVLRRNAEAQDEAADAAKRRHDSAQEILDAEKELALAEAGEDPEKRAFVEADFRQAQEQRKQLAGQASIEAAHRKLRDTRAAANEARAGLRTARGVRDTNLDQLNLIDVQLILDQEELTKQQKELEAGERGEGIPAAGIFGKLGMKSVTAQGRAAAARSAITGLKERMDVLQGRKITAQGRISAAGHQIQSLERQDLEANQALPGLQAAYAKAIADETSRRQTAEIVNAMKIDAAFRKAETEALNRATEVNHRALRLFTESVTQLAEKHGLSAEVVMNLLRRQH